MKSKQIYLYETVERLKKIYLTQNIHGAVLKFIHCSFVLYITFTQHNNNLYFNYNNIHDLLLSTLSYLFVMNYSYDFLRSIIKTNGYK